MYPKANKVLILVMIKITHLYQVGGLIIKSVLYFA